MENGLKNYILLEKIYPLEAQSKKMILSQFNTYEQINWKYIHDNKAFFKIDLSTNLERSYEINEKCQTILNQLHREQVETIFDTSIYYPETLQNYKPAVKALFAKGNRQLLSREHHRVSIVGSRKPTAYGRKIAYDLAYYLASHGICIVSGMALGIDALAHKGALDANGKTIAVLASGVNYIYPNTNEKLYTHIIEENGLILSEQFLDEAPAKYHFPLRNRIISALSDVVIIIEAGEKSGSLITAMHALDQGKTVFSLPGSILSPQSSGSNRLIYDGATPLIHFSHVLECFGMNFTNSESSIKKLPPLTDLASKFYQCLCQEKQLDFNEIQLRFNCEYSEINIAVGELILEDLCEYMSLNEIRLL